MHDQRTGLTHDYTKRARHQKIAHTQIISNLGTKIDRSELWNLAEMRENRKDARTAKEFVIALPHELDKQERQELAIAFAQHLVNRYDCVADVAIHAPSRAGDERNYHAHIMLTTRKAELDQQNNLVLTDKIDLELSNAKRKKLGLEPTSKEILAIRQDWERIANAHLERAGIAERIDHRSYEEIGNGKQAQIHAPPPSNRHETKGDRNRD
ncbi:MobA/MobL family protein [Neisseria sp. CCUG17229]|uniref:MobA/MobL family protein n=1 Tax=Neisseria sp. CCUG17229 TaxID=3392036 RepID=UPI003A0FF2F7